MLVLVLYINSQKLHIRNRQPLILGSLAVPVVLDYARLSAGASRRDRDPIVFTVGDPLVT